MPLHPLMTTGTLLVLTLCAAHAVRGEETHSNERPIPEAVDAAIVKMINTMPPAAKGQSGSSVNLRLEMHAPRILTSVEETLPGGTAAGRVTAIYVRISQHLFLAMERAPSTLRNSADRWVEVRVPGARANPSHDGPALLDVRYTQVEVGDAVEIRLAHPSRNRVSPLPEITRVTTLIAKRHEPLARLYGEDPLSAHNDEEHPTLATPAESPKWLVRTAK